MGDTGYSKITRTAPTHTDDLLYQALVESMEEGVLVHDATGKVVTFNPSVLRILGVTESVLLDRYSLSSLWRAVYEDGSTLLREEYPPAVTLQTGMSLSGVVLGVFRGSAPEAVAWLSVSSRLLRRVGEPPYGVVSTIRDITATKTTERALRESEGKLRAFIQDAPVGILMTNKLGRCEFVNRTWSEMSGLSLEGSLGEGWTEQIHELDRAGVLLSWKRLTELGLPFKQEFRFQRPDGSVVWMSTKTVTMREGVGGHIMGYLWAATDITDRKKAEEERDRLFVVSLDLLCIARLDGYFKRVNPSFTRVLGYSSEELLSRPLLDLVHGEDRTDTQDQLGKLANGFDAVKFECRCKCKDGSWKWISWHFPAPVDGLLYVVARDVTERKRTEAALVKLAHTDQLTGLQNRITLMSNLAGKIARAERYDGRLAVIFIDLDGFKAVNDTHGHDAGDVVLREVAGRIREAVRRSDIVARLGGDEYVVVADDTNLEADASRVVAKIRRAVEEPILLPTGVVVRVRASIGVATYPKDSSDPEVLLKLADKAMYIAKAGS